MAISFNNIPVTLRTPGTYIEVDSRRAVNDPAQITKVLVIGQRLATGSVAAETPTNVLSPVDAETYFGRGSIIANMIKASLSVAPLIEHVAIALDDAPASVKASGTFTVTGTATGAGTFYVYVGGRRIPVSVAVGDTATVVGDAIEAAIDAESDLEADSANVTGTVTVTAKNAGTAGNDIALAVNTGSGETMPAGVSVAVVAMASGATDPDVDDAIAAFGDVQYDVIISQLNDATNMGKLETELASRWGPTVQLRGHAFHASRGTQSALTTLGNARNSQFNTIVGAGLSPSPSWIWAALVGGLDAAEPDPARPRQTLTLPVQNSRTLAPVEADRFTQAERAVLLTDGIATYTVDRTGTCRIERLITTYQTNSNGTADASYLDRTTPGTLKWLAESLAGRIALRYPRHKLADDGTNFGPGQAIVTPALIKSEVLAWFSDREAEGLVEDFAQFENELVVERNTSDANRVDVLLSPNLLNQFRVLAGQIQFLL